MCVQEIDFSRFEQLFKLSSASVQDEADGSPLLGRTFKRKPEAVTLLEPQRIRNVGKCARRPLFARLCTNQIYLIIDVL